MLLFRSGCLTGFRLLPLLFALLFACCRCAVVGCRGV